MNKYSAFLLLTLIFTCCLTACKKDAKPQVPTLQGKWYVKKNTLVQIDNGVTDTTLVTLYNDTSAYFKFNNDGSGTGWTILDPNIFSTPDGHYNFNYKVTGQDIIFSQPSGFLITNTYSFSTPNANTLIIKGVNADTHSQFKQEVDLSR